MTDERSRLLAVSVQPPWPAINGVRTKLSGLLESVGMPWDIICATPAPAGRQLDGKWLVLDAPPVSNHRLRALPQRLLPAHVAVPVTPVLRHVQDLVESGVNVGVVHLDTFATAHLAAPIRTLLQRLGQSPVVVCSLNDAYSLLLAGEGLEATPRRTVYSRYVQRVERRLLPEADFVDVVSRRDVEWLHAVAPEATVRLVPLGIRCDDFLGPRLPPRWDVLYVGALAEGGSFRAVKRMFDNVLPEVRRQYPALRAGIAGPPPPPTLARDLQAFQATYLGFVEDLSELLRSTRVLLVPSDQGAGTPTKALQAMAAGTPVVGMGALDGIPDGIDGVSHSRATTLDDFAARILRVLGDAAHAETLSEGGRQLVTRTHDWPAVVRRYVDFRPGVPSGGTSC